MNTNYVYALFGPTILKYRAKEWGGFVIIDAKNAKITSVLGHYIEYGIPFIRPWHTICFKLDKLRLNSLIY